MRDFMVEFLKYVKFHGQFTEGVTEIHATRYQWIFFKHTWRRPISWRMSRPWNRELSWSIPISTKPQLELEVALLF